MIGHIGMGVIVRRLGGYMVAEDYAHMYKVSTETDSPVHVENSTALELAARQDARRLVDILK